MFWVILTSILGGGVPTFSKMALEVFQPFTFTLLRCLAATILLLPLVLKYRKKEKQNFRKIILVSLLGTGNVVFFALGVRHTTAMVAQILYAAGPIIATILSALILKLRLSKTQIIGIICGFLGVCVVVISPESIHNLGSMTGALLVLAGVISYATYTVLSKTLTTEFTPLELTTAMVFTTIGVQIILVTFEIGNYVDIIHNLTTRNIIGVVYVGIIGTAVFFLLYQKVIREINPVYASMILYLQPISAYIWASLLLGEKLTINVVIGCAITLLGATLVMKKMQKKREVKYR